MTVLKDRFQLLEKIYGWLRFLQLNSLTLEIFWSLWNIINLLNFICFNPKMAQELPNTLNKTQFVPAIKSYRNEDFLNSETSRNIRILCEYEVFIFLIYYNHFPLIFTNIFQRSPTEGWKNMVFKVLSSLKI